MVGEGARVVCLCNGKKGSVPVGWCVISSGLKCMCFVYWYGVGKWC